MANAPTRSYRAKFQSQCEIGWVRYFTVAASSPESALDQIDVALSGDANKWIPISIRETA